jgi:hypothetical protein
MVLWSLLRKGRAINPECQPAGSSVKEITEDETFGPRRHHPEIKAVMVEHFKPIFSGPDSAYLKIVQVHADPPPISPRGTGRGTKKDLMRVEWE